MSTKHEFSNDNDRYDEIVEYIANHPAVYSTEIADLLDLHRNGANRRLEDLETEGRVEWRRPHENVPKLWYVPE